MSASEPVYLSLDAARGQHERGGARTVAGAPRGVPGRGRAERVGEILARQGVLDEPATLRIVTHQRDSGQLFGEAAVALRLVEPQAVARALAEQADFVVDEDALTAIAPEVIAAREPSDPSVEDLRALRTRILLDGCAEQRPGRARVIAVVSADQGEGRSWLAANLAVVFAQLGRRTVLVDADLRRPRQHRLFGQAGADGLAAWLGGRAPGLGVQAVPGVRHLELLCAGSRPANPQELLSGEAFGQMVSVIAADCDTVVIDTPPAGAYADFAFAAIASDSVLLLVRRHRSRHRAVLDLADRLVALGRPAAGVILNEKT